MRHIKVIFSIIEGISSDILIALLADIGFSGFEEANDELLAYIEESQYSQEELAAIAAQCNVDFNTEIVEMQNWNAIWESNFQPVIVDDLCTIRAHFHDIEVTTPYEIVITPKMSFGTGHHATTQLVMLLMKDIDFKGKSVLDFGTGTGVLAIFAEMLGANEILAIDNDEWSVENAMENIARNKCNNINVQLGGIEDIPEVKNDIILANINRHILLQYMSELYARLEDNGTIIMSGLLVDDKEIMLDAATGAGFRSVKIIERNNWIALSFIKNG